MPQECKIFNLRQAKSGGFKNGPAGLLGRGSYLMIMAAISLAIANTSQMHLHTQSLLLCSEQTAIKQQTSLLVRQRHLSELNAANLCTDLLFGNDLQLSTLLLT